MSLLTGGPRVARRGRDRHARAGRAGHPPGADGPARSGSGAGGRGGDAVDDLPLSVFCPDCNGSIHCVEGEDPLPFGQMVKPSSERYICLQDAGGAQGLPRVILHILAFKACRRSIKFGDQRRGSAAKGGRHSTILFNPVSEIYVCQVPICAVAA